jgi:amino acid adenylation domain-containing protein/FkbM family methyltransferase
MSQSGIENYWLSPQQKHLWPLQSREAAPVYHTQGLLLIEGALATDRLAHALREVVRRHEILRTSFPKVPGLAIPVQAVRPDLEPALSEADLTVLAGEEQESALRELCEREKTAPFDLESASPLRALLIATGPARHLLVLTLPALCADRRTLAALGREIASVYGGAPGSGEEPLQYAAVADWLNELQTSEEAAEGRRYWKRFDLSPLDGMRLPFEAVGGNGFVPRRLVQDLPPEVLGRLDAALAARAWELADFLLACWCVLLWRLTGRNDLVVGVMSDGRGDEALAETLGLLARHLPVLCPCGEATPFEQVPAALHAAVLRARELEDCFSWDGAAPGQEAPGLPFCFEISDDGGRCSAGEARFGLLELYSCFDRFRIKLCCARSAAGLRAEWHFDAGLFSESEIALLADRFAAVVESAADSPQTALGALRILGRSEWHRLSRELQGRRADFPLVDRPLHELFAAQAVRTPDAPAVLSEDETVTYAELDARSNRLAHLLGRLGAGPETRIAVCLERSVEMVVALLAILKAGGAYVPLDPAYPVDRLSYMLEDSGAGVLIVSGARALPLSPGSARLLSLAEVSAELSRESGRPPAAGVTADQLAYVIYTSGSTGRPKGVMISHRSINNRLLWTLDEYPMDASDTLLQKTPFSFDASVWEIFAPLLAGARLLIARPGGQQDPAYLVRAVIDHGVTVLQLVPSLLRAVLEEEGLRECRSLRRLFCGGEALPILARDRLAEVLGVELVNLYGPTETAIDTTFWPCGQGGGQTVVPIGRPLANMEVYLLEEGGVDPVAFGLPGEICAGGVGLARGYHGRPELSAEKFVPHPFSGSPGARLYRTGDRGRWSSGGALEYLGRIDHQVKVRGFRIELGEIEAALRGDPAVRDAVVVVREDRAGDPRLVGYVTSHSRPAAPESVHVLPNGLEVDSFHPSETDAVYREIFTDGYLRHGITLEPGDCVFDVGANIGMFTLFVQDQCPDVKVLAFEPAPPLVEKLRANVARYGLDAEVFDHGLASEERTAEFTFYPQWSAMSGLYADRQEDERVTRAVMANLLGDAAGQAENLLAGRFRTERYACRLRALSDVVRERGIARIDLLKIDVEKSELEVLRGIAEPDWSKVRQIVLEVHDAAGRLAEICSLLEERGFRLTVEQDSWLAGTDLYNVYAVRPEAARRETGLREPRLPRRRPVLEIEELRARLAGQLPDYMVPSLLAEIEELPLTPHGKIDRAALPWPLPDPVRSRREPSATPRSPTEEMVATLWGEALGVPVVDAGGDFFKLGGHSLLAIQVVNQIRTTFQVKLSLRDLFDRPTVAAFAAWLERARMEQRGLSSLAISRLEPDRRGKGLPPSFAQQRLWLIQTLDPGNAAYNLGTVLRISGRLDAGALERALAEIARRHEALRTVFPALDGGPVQIVLPDLSPRLPAIDLSALPAARGEAAGRLLAEGELSRPFDLAGGPLIRKALVRLQEREHLLAIAVHHIVFDGWSVGVFRRELAALYDAFAAGHASPLPEPPLQYADFVAWQRQWISGETLQILLSYWQRQLDALPLLDLPADRRRPAVQTHRGASRALVFPGPLTSRLGELGRGQGATLFMTLLAIFQAELARYSGQEDFAVGSPMAGRDRSELQDLIGFFVNTVVLRSPLSGNPEFRELIPRVRETVLAAYLHQDLPFELLVEKLQPERDLSRSPLFQVLFVLQSFQQERAALRELELRAVRLPRKSAQFDLTLELTEMAGGLAASLVYNADLFDGATAQRILDHFHALAGAVAADPSRRLADLPLLSAAERWQAVGEWNDTATRRPSGRRIHDLVADQAERNPGAVAMLGPDGQITYAELDREARRLAGRLRQLGVAPEAPVGVCLQRSPALVIALLAVLRAGGAYLPLDPAYPQERLAFMLEDSGARWVLTQREHEDALRSSGARRLLLEQELAEPMAAASSGMAEARDTNLAYIIYTSGSTGRPKGVAIEHRAVVAFIDWARDAFTPADLSGVLASTSVCFDLSVFELWVPLACGGRVILAENALELPRLAMRDQVTLLNTVPSVAAELLRGDGFPPALRTVNLAGEPLDERLVDRLYERGVGQVHDLYGPSEATTYSTCVRRAAGGPATIGRPIAGTQVYVLDAQGTPVPPGVVGEMFIGGAGLARGYLGRPDLTAEKFVPHPLSGEAGARLYRTGDLARHFPDGRLEFLGRRDRQVKIRGFRIELGETEAALARLPGVQDCIVVVQGKNGDRGLVGYVVPGPHGSLDPARLRDDLQASLPAFLVPSRLVLLDRLPRTPNGKVDLAVLPKPDLSGAVPEARPRSSLELQLLRLWEDVLGTGPIGIQDSFFDLGGHSFLAVRLLWQMRDRLGIDLPLAALFQAPTVERLARMVTGNPEQWRGGSPLVVLQPEGRARPFFCVHSIGGNVMRFQDLARHFAPDRPFYGVQAADPTELGGECSSIEQTARDYVEAVKGVQPTGPYLLGGYSFGSVVAFEMARQLEAGGEQVSLLALLDGGAPGNARVAEDLGDLTLLLGFARDLVRMRGADLEFLARDYQEMSEAAATERVLAQLHQAGVLPAEIDAVWISRFLRGIRVRLRALQSYCPEPYAGRIAFFRSTEEETATAEEWREAGGDPDDPVRGWNRLSLQPVELHQVPGHHVTMVNDPLAATLAEALKSCIRHAEASVASPEEIVHA